MRIGDSSTTIEAMIMDRSVREGKEGRDGRERKKKVMIGDYGWEGDGN